MKPLAARLVASDWHPGVPPASLRDAPAPWLLRVDRTREAVQASAAELEVLLSHAERQRRNALRRNEDRERFLLGRAVLRLQLGHWLERDPASLRLIQGPHGKPALAPEGERTPQFNVAHSGDLILLAFHPRHPVGVDVERQRPDLDWEPVARRVLSAGELRELQVLPAAQRGEAFLAAWCRLEARLKARGDGFSGLERLREEQRLAPMGPEAPPTPALWDVAVPAGYRAAVALAPSH